MLVPNPELEVLLPVHNEAESIERTVREIYGELSPRVRFQFIITEDGSVDETRSILTSLRQSIPMKLIMSPTRKGYAPAVTDGMKQLEAPYLLCLDSDGQCDPRDFWKFWDSRQECEVLIGWRVHRKDPLARRLLSRGFHALYQAMYNVPIHDPSCPFVLARREVVEQLVPELGGMREGLWWEFTARARRHKFCIKELPINHRGRLAGKTRVYNLSKLPGIANRHLTALLKIWWQTRSASRGAGKPGKDEGRP
jgi:dolichol-phosphate mannosyltransferase